MKRLACFLLFLMAAGCAVQPYRPKPIEPAVLFEQLESRRLDNPDLHDFISKQSAGRVGSWPPASWNVETLTLAALYFNPELDLARKKWAVADAATATASQRPNPVLVLPLEVATDIPEDEKPWTIGFGIEIPIETAGKRGYRIARAAHLSDGARYRIGAVAWKVRSQLHTALLELHLAERRFELLTTQATLAEKTVSLLERRRREGAASGSEVEQQRIRLASQVAERNAADRDRAIARSGIASAIGVPVSEIERVALDLEHFGSLRAAMPDRDMRRAILLSRPELRAALAEYEASQAALQLQVAKQYPDVSLGPGYTWDAGANRFAFGVAGIQLPVFHRNQGPIAEAEAARSEAAAAVAEVQSRIFQEAERTVSAYRSALAGLEEADRLLAHERQRVARVRRAFDAGQIDRLELTLAEQALALHMTAHDESVARIKRAIAALQSALPGTFARNAEVAMTRSTQNKDGNESR